MGCRYDYSFLRFVVQAHSLEYFGKKIIFADLKILLQAEDTCVTIQNVGCCEPL